MGIYFWVCTEICRNPQWWKWHENSQVLSGSSAFKPSLVLSASKGSIIPLHSCPHSCNILPKGTPRNKKKSRQVKMCFQVVLRGSLSVISCRRKTPKKYLNYCFLMWLFVSAFFTKGLLLFYCRKIIDMLLKRTTYRSSKKDLKIENFSPFHWRISHGVPFSIASQLT